MALSIAETVKNFIGYKGKDTTPEQIAKEEQEIKLVQDMANKFQVSRQAKQPKVDIWNKCIDAYNSDYFKNKNKPDYKSDEISNFIFSTLETIKPIMIDNDPKILALPKTPDGTETADEIQQALDSEWIRDKMGRKLPQGITLALQIGTAIFGTIWNAKDENGLGNVENILINPYNLFPDPMATSVENAEYIIYATYKHINVLKQKFPDKADLLVSGTINYKELVSSGNDTSNVNNQILILECWARDYTTFDEDTVDDKGNKITIKKRKYPRGKVITCAPELNILLEDKQNPYEDGQFPFTLFKCYDIPFEFWGKGEVEQLLSPQTYINDLVNQIIDNAKLTANMPWIIDKNSGIGKGQLTNRPGLIVRKNPGTEVGRQQPPAMPNYVAEMVDTLKLDIETISGIHDVTQGRKPGSISAASAIMALQEAAQARIRLKVKTMEQILGEMGTKWFSRMKQFWVTNRWIRVTNAEDETTFVEMTPEKLQAGIDFQILAGSTMPANKNAMLDLMIRLAQTPAEDGLPMVDRQTVLEYTNIPDKKKILDRFAQHVQGKQNQEIEAQQQLQVQQQEMAKQQQAMEIAKQQMLAEHQHGLESQRMQMQGQIDSEKTAPTDAQLQQIIQMIQSDPQLLQQFMDAAQNGQESAVLGGQNVPIQQVMGM